MTTPDPSPASAETRALIEKAERVRKCVFIAVEEPVARDISDTIRDLLAALASVQPQAEQRKADFMAGHLAAQDQTDRFGETHEAPEEAWAAYLAQSPAPEVPDGNG